MSRASFFRRLIGSARRPESKPVRRSRLTIEALEDRAVPATFVVNSVLDVVDANDGVLTFREAINAANANSQADLISFNANVFSTHKTITLGGTDLMLSEAGYKTTITGPAAGVTISGNNSSRIFTIDSGVTAAISDLTLSNGFSSDRWNGGGGGILNDGTLALTDCTVTHNTANLVSSAFITYGGGILNDGTLTLTNCTVSGNTST